MTNSWEKLGLTEFLAGDLTRLRIKHLDKDQLCLQGEHKIHAITEGGTLINETFNIKVVFPSSYPKDIPIVYGLSDNIVRDINNHVYNDGSFCLGSDLHLKLIIKSSPQISDFFNRIVDPFLYSYEYKKRFGSYPYGELSHGTSGLIDDYELLFDIKGKKALSQAFRALSNRKRVANKLICPCGCGRRLGVCKYRFKLNRFRGLQKRRWYADHIKKFYTR
jgi:hypothetical protein